MNRSTYITSTLVSLFVVGAAFGCKAKMSASLSTESGLDVKADLDTGKDTDTDTGPAAPVIPPAEELIAAALQSEHRSEEARSRDQWRHPAETLTFFGLQPQMTVIELEPGGGWYTEILAPVLKDFGRLIVTNRDPSGSPDDPNTEMAKEYADKLAANPELFGKVEQQIVDDSFTLGEPESADMVVTFRNSHLWAKDRVDAKVYKAVFDALRPGGFFGVVQHRAGPKGKAARWVLAGYLPESYVIEKIQAAGFELVGKSEINANPKDKRNYARGVWSLPPVLAMGEKNKDKFLAIGESDRMTLLFRKPGGEPEPVASETEIGEPQATPDPDAEVEPETAPAAKSSEQQ